jgi:hypothetical protein
MEGSSENKEINDSLRIEASTLSPKEANDARETLGEMSQFLEGRFGTFMPDSARERATNARNNLIVVDDINQFLFSFLPEEKGIDSIYEEDLQGFYHLPSGIIVVKDQERLWEDAGPEIRTSAIRLFGDEETARNTFGNFFALGTLAHELGHAYLNPDLPPPLREIGAYYLQSEVSREFFKGISGVSKPIINFYEHFVQKYGDDFNRFMFGRQIGILTRLRLLREIKNLERKASTHTPELPSDGEQKPSRFDNFKKVDFTKEIVKKPS